MGLKVTVISSMDRLVAWLIEWGKMSKTMSSNVLFCPKPKYILSTVIEEERK